MSKYKNFDVDKAAQLCIAYKKKRHYEKALLLAELISWQIFFGNTSIVGIQISLNRIYKKNTIKIVLSDLGYELMSYKTDYVGVIPGKSTLFCFKPKSSDATEG